MKVNVSQQWQCFVLSSTINLVRSSTYKAIKNVLTFANLTPFPGGYHTKPVITTFQIQIFNRNDGISFAKARLLVYRFLFLPSFTAFSRSTHVAKAKRIIPTSCGGTQFLLFICHEAILEWIKHSHIKLCITLQRWFLKLQKRFVEPL